MKSKSGILKMKHEIFICDICGSRFESVEAVCCSVIISDNDNILSLEQVCSYCIGTINSALERCKQKNV